MSICIAILKTDTGRAAYPIITTRDPEIVAVVVRELNRRLETKLEDYPPDAEKRSQKERNQ